MDDYIRKAIELADGWTLKETGAFHSPFCEPMFDIAPEMLSQPHKDALAAQLVRQVDVLSGYWVETTEGVATVCKSTGDSTDQGCGFMALDGEDRTMITIKAIVDSGVLSVKNKDNDDG